MKTLGIILIVLGAIMMGITGFNLVTKKKVADIGPVEISKTENRPVSWSPIIGVGLLIGGIAVVATAKKS